MNRNEVRLSLLKFSSCARQSWPYSYFFATKIEAQKDTTKLLVGFPITNYMVDLNDNTKIVQVVPGGIWEIKDKQLGLVKDIYRDGHVDTSIKGWGNCSLIKR
jgi:hypothetical protein